MFWVVFWYVLRSAARNLAFCCAKAPYGQILKVVKGAMGRRC